jgi:hypothetical protein
MNRLSPLVANKYVTIIVMLAIAMWSLGFPTWVPFTGAATLTTISDTLSDSDLGVSADHTIVFTTPTAVAADGSSTTITFDGSFNISTSTATIGFADIDVSTVGLGAMTLAADCTGSEHLGVTVTATEISFEHCTGDSGVFDAGGTTTILIGDNATGGAGNDQIINPEGAGSYEITVTTYDSTYTLLDQGNTRIAIIDDVVVTASVDTTLTFTINGLPAGVTVNGSPTTTADTTTATTLPFGTLTPYYPKTLAQSLHVTTNATNGFTVTANQNQNLTSSTGADIDRFQNDTPPGSPTGWTQPAGTIGSENTYGHMGITTDDTTLAGGDDFVTDLWAGDFVANAREVFYHDGPADGVTNNQGSTTVGYQVEVTNLQEAGSDYTANITYVATPIF